MPENDNDEISVWRVLQLILNHYTNRTEESAVIIEALLIELKNEETLVIDAEVALQYWRGCCVAKKETKLLDYRLDQFWKRMEAIETIVYKNPVYYGGPEAVNDGPRR